MASFEYVMVEQCAPVLAALKPANLFRYVPKPRESVRGLSSEWDERLSARGVRVACIKACPEDGSGLVYVYRRPWVERFVSRPENRAILARFGYDVNVDFDGLLAQLSARLCTVRPFPHEIGSFLGYPSEDVTGFIDNKGQNYRFCGFWKVYGDAEAARAIFTRYRKCIDVYVDRFESGMSLMGLAVAS